MNPNLNPCECVCVPGSLSVRRSDPYAAPTFPIRLTVSIYTSFVFLSSSRRRLILPGPKNALGFSRGKLLERYVAP